MRVTRELLCVNVFICNDRASCRLAGILICCLARALPLRTLLHCTVLYSYLSESLSRVQWPRGSSRRSARASSRWRSSGSCAAASSAGCASSLPPSPLPSPPTRTPTSTRSLLCFCYVAPRRATGYLDYAVITCCLCGERCAAAEQF